MRAGQYSYLPVFKRFLFDPHISTTEKDLSLSYSIPFGWLKIHQEMGYGRNGHDLRHGCTLKGGECIFVHNTLLNTGITTYLCVMVCRGGQRTWWWSNCCHIFSTTETRQREFMSCSLFVRVCPNGGGLLPSGVKSIISVWLCTYTSRRPHLLYLPEIKIIIPDY